MMQHIVKVTLQKAQSNTDFFSLQCTPLYKLNTSQLTFTCSKSLMEAIEKRVKYFQN